MRSRSLLFLMALLALAALLGGLGLSGCGYGVANQAPVDLPPNVRSLAIDRVNNPTLETWLPALLVARFRDEITQRDQLTWAQDQAHAEGLVTLNIERFFLSTELSNAEDQTIKFNANITLDASITRRLDQQVVWRSERIAYSESYFAVNERAARDRAVELAVRRLVDRLGQAY